MVHTKHNQIKEKNNLNIVNKKLIKFFKDYPKTKLSLIAIGNSISDGFSMSEPGNLLLARNSELITLGKDNGLEVDTYQFSRSENNNSLSVFNWIINNYSEKDVYQWNKKDYKRFIKNGNTLLNDNEINKFFNGGSDKKIQDILFNNDKHNANVVILNLGTGSLLDVVTRHGALSIFNVFNSINRDIHGIIAILELIQNNNRNNGANTQVYLCGAPRILNTIITDIFINRKLKIIVKEYANVTYVPSFKRQIFYKNQKGKIIFDLHYNQAEYYCFLAKIENKIIENYFIKDLTIDLDRTLFKMSNDNDVNDGNYKKDDVKKIITDFVKEYENKTGNYNCFIKYIKQFIKRRYPFDYYRCSSKNNLYNDINKKRYKNGS